jgi:hypothetical protein
MKSIRTLCIALALIVAAAALSPAGAVGLFAQWQDSKDGDSGFGLGVSQNFSIVPVFSLEPRISWIRYSADEGDGNLDMFPLELFGRAKFGMFYGGVGLGYYIMSGDHAPDNSLGGFAALGIEFSLASLGAFAEARYLYLEPEYEELSTNVDMSGIGASLGVILPF